MTKAWYWLAFLREPQRVGVDLDNVAVTAAA